ncbi:alkane hydroxylase MAH1-like [Chenopodium quinoa]|uniref:alkane hydroxylase MAH1-like n=1 Tax=Chenopodium quinoa TaxID=63459 RepID=UPI000B78C6A3|nr:alkane hydroxylase MAH1-like [Chenopodium quinoa]
MEFLVIFMIFLSIFFLCYLFRNKNGIPTNWPIVGMLFALLVNVHQVHDWLTELLEKLDMNFLFKGPWLANMKMFITLDPSNVHYIMSKNFTNYPKGTKFNEMFDVFGDGIFNVDSDLWKLHRKMAHTFIGHPKFHQFLQDKIWEKVEKGLIPLLDHVSKQGLVIDLQDLFYRFSLDTICTLVTGCDLGSLSIDWPHVPFANALDDAEEVILYRHFVPMSVWKFCRWLGVGNEKKYKKAWEILDDFVYKCIAKKREEKKQELMKPQVVGVDLLTLYMDESQSINVTSASDKFLRDTILSFFIAGRDTTSTALSWFFYLLSKNSRVESKIRDELSTMETVHDYHNLIYVHGALCEALRLYPPVAFEQKASIESDVLPSGHQVDPNMQIIFNMYAMGRMKAIWGEDCYEFKPEGWISERRNIRHEPSYKFLAFNAGPRTCLGKNMSFFQMKAVVATILRNYTFQAVEGHQVVPDISLILRMKHGFMVKVYRY